MTSVKMHFWAGAIGNAQLPSVWPDWVIYWTLGNFLKPLATINLPKSTTLFGIFYKCVQIFHFSSKKIFGQLLLTFGDFFWSHCLPWMCIVTGIAISQFICLFWLQNDQRLWLCFYRDIFFLSHSPVKAPLRAHLRGGLDRLIIIENVLISLTVCSTEWKNKSNEL